MVDETLGGVSEQCSPNKMPFQREIRREKKNVKSFKIKGTTTLHSIPKCNFPRNSFFFVTILKSRSSQFLTLFLTDSEKTTLKNQRHFFLCKKPKNPNSFFFLTDYLDEEYVDLDWAESTTAESTMISAAEEQQQEQEGSGEVEEIDDEDEHEGSSKNEAHLSEIDGSGEFGKKTVLFAISTFSFSWHFKPEKCTENLISRTKEKGILKKVDSCVPS